MLEQFFQSSAAYEGMGTAEFMVDGVSIPVALAEKNDSRQLVVFYNGAVSRRLSPSAKVFQRATWANEINANCLYICDPSLLRSESGSLGWGQVDETRWAGTLFPAVVRRVGDLLNVEAPQRLHYGSSAGGFQALVTAAADVGSSALVNNPQTNWLEYDLAYAVRQTLRRAFNEASKEQVLRDHARRCQVWQWFESVGHVPEFRYLLNVASRSDVEKMFEPLNNYLLRSTILPEGANWSVGFYNKKNLGHNPLPRGETVAAINHEISRMKAASL